ncbi:MAG: efflux RND transporter permease subunit, partial [Faecalibacterium sp.]|nr:efflux RND transporter permease subunit [Faecalibacterium sp.]
PAPTLAPGATATPLPTFPPLPTLNPGGGILPLPSATPGPSATPTVQPSPAPTLPPADSGDVGAAVENTYKAMDALSKLLDQMPELLAGLEQAMGAMTQAQLEASVAFATAQVQLAQGEAQLEAARQQYETQKEAALESANLDTLLTISTLSQMIYAQNFAMPAGYIDDADDNTWLLKVGDEFEDADDIANVLLASIEDVGDIRLQDVANVTVIDNADESYARLNGENAVILSIFKSSTVGNNELSKNCYEAFEELAEKYPGTKVVTLMDQGDYIELILNSVLSSMGLGAVLAIFVLALFLKDVLPTLVVAVSIPLSVLFAIVLMYFTDISLNMMSLSGLALGIGMLVDNSVVVIENIYRLRNRGVQAPRAAVQGTRQVAGSIVSSTLTTVCVFMPLLFTSGMVRQLLMPLGLTIGYCLMASLIVAMTVVPAAASTLLKNTKPKPHPWFDKVMNWYGKSLAWCLQHKAAPLLVAVALLVLCIWRVLTMGIVMLPEMTANSITVSVRTTEGLTREESYAAADRALDAMLTVEGIEDVGLMDGAAASSMMGGMGLGGGSSYGSYTGYITMPSSTSGALINRMTDGLNALNGTDPDYTISASAGGLNDMTALLGSGLSLSIYGQDMDTLLEISEDVIEIVESVEGFTNASNGIEEGDPTVHLVIDRDAAMAKGLTVAQIYMEIANRMTTSATATTVSVNGANMDVILQNHNDPLTLENLMEIEFETTVMGDTGASETETHTLGEFATIEYEVSVPAVERENQTRYLTVTARTEAGENVTLLSRKLSVLLDEYEQSGKLPHGYEIRMGGETSSVNDMVVEMSKMLAMGCAFVYLVMVAQFQSLLSPFIVLLTVPLAFTGGMIGLMVAGQQLSLLSLMGFVVLMGTVVNNGIVFVDYVNQLRLGGMERHPALIATGKTRMRPILMTTLTTVLAMMQMIFGDDMGSQLGGGMAIVIVGGLTYATIMTLYIIPVLYDILFRKEVKEIDLGSENLDDVPDDAAEFIAQAQAEEQARLAALAAAQQPDDALDLPLAPLETEDDPDET